MSTISGVSAASLYANLYATSATQSGVGQSATNAFLADSTSTSFGNGLSPVLTYNAAGLLSAFQQANAGNGTTPQTPQQAAENAVLYVQSVITQTLSSLSLDTSSNASSNSSSPDIFSLMAGLPSSSTDVFGLTQNTAAGNGQTTRQTLQQAMLNAQIAMNATLGSLGATPSK